MTALVGKVALVTGGASGLGAGLCRALAGDGATVVVSDVDLEAAQALATELGTAGRQAEGRALDVCDHDAVEAVIDSVVERHGRIDYLFNNAGIGVAGPFEEVGPEAWRRIVDINLLGTVWGSRVAYRHMRAAGGGHIVNIASMWGICPGVLQSAYTATKHAVVGMSLALRAEARDAGVKVTAVCPGYIRTQLFGSAVVESRGLELDLSDPEALIPFDFLDVDTAVRRTLRGVRRNRAIVAFPGYVQLLWRLQRLWPWALSWGSTMQLRRMGR